MGLFGSFCLYTMRINMSLAIVCMVKDTTDNDTSYNTSTATNNSLLSIDTAQQQCLTETLANKRRWPGEFEWSRKLKGFILSSFFIGYISTQIFGGWLGQKIGGKRTVGFSMFLLCLATLLTPIGARTHPGLVITLRIICGLLSGVYYPAFYTLIAQWIPPLERTKHVGLLLAGTNVGTLVTFSVSGYLCEYGFDGGWPSIFYTFGCVSLIWCAAWFILITDAPANHRWISSKEKIYIDNTLGKAPKQTKSGHTPWLRILTCRRTLCIFVAQFAYAWTRYTILTSLPQYFKDVLYFNIKSNGLYNALPYLLMFVMALGIAWLADWLLHIKCVSVTNLRKLLQSGGFFPPAVICVVMGFLYCNQRTLAVGLLCVCVGFTSFSRAGIFCNIAEVAPKYSGVIMGIANTCGMLAAILSPIVASALTPHGAQHEWRNVFYVCAAITLVGEVVYVTNASAEPQPWGVQKQIHAVDV